EVSADRDGPSHEIADEEYAVYSALLKAPPISPSNGKTARLIVVGLETNKPTIEEVRRAAGCHEDFPAGQPVIQGGPHLLSDDLRPLVDDLLIKNSQTYLFDRRFSFGRPY